MDPRMAPFDAVMFDVETDPILRSVITSVVVLDSTPDPARLRFRVDRLTRLLPKLRQRVVGHGLSPIPPRWETVADFDLDYHLQQVTLPNGSLNDLLDRLALWSEADFDHARPLWGIATYDGLDGGRSAVAIKIHHSITDGVGGMMLAAALFDVTATAPDPTDLPAPPEPTAPSWRDRFVGATRFEARSLLGDAAGALRATADAGRAALADPFGSVLMTQEFLGSAGRILAPADQPMSPLLTQRSLALYFSELSVDLGDLKAAGKAAGGSLNDAFVAAVVGGMRDYHERFGEIPPTLRLHMPINLRSADDAESGNKWIPARFPVPLNEADAARRIRQLHPLLGQARNEPALGVSEQVYKVLMTLPNNVTTKIAGGLMKGTDFVASNVPGPPIPVFLVGARVQRFLAFAPKGGAAVNVALMSYNGRADVGINIDRVAVAHPEVLSECFAASFQAVVATVA